MASSWRLRVLMSAFGNRWVKTFNVLSILVWRAPRASPRVMPARLAYINASRLASRFALLEHIVVER